MAIVYSDDVKEARLQVVVDAIGPAGVLVIGTAALAGGATGVLVEIPFNNPSFNITVDEMEVNGLPVDTVATDTGIAALAEFRHSDGTVVANNLTVGLSGSGSIVTINAVEISTGQDVQVTIGTITHG